MVTQSLEKKVSGFLKTLQSNGTLTSLVSKNQEATQAESPPSLESMQQFCDHQLSLEENRNNYFLLLLAGQIESAKENFKRAVFFYTKALQQKANGEVYCYLAKEYLRIESYKQAMLFIRKAIEEQETIEAWDLAGQIHWHQGQLEEAEAMCDKIELLVKQGQKAQFKVLSVEFLLEHYYEQKIFQKVVKFSRIQLNLGIKTFQVLEYMGIALLNLGSHKEALPFLEKSRLLHPKNSEYKIPTFEEKKKSLGNISQKIVLMEQDIQKTPKKKDDSNVHFDLGFLYFYNGDYKKAETTFQKALAIRKEKIA